jgi:hypothetical protein
MYGQMQWEITLLIKYYFFSYATYKKTCMTNNRFSYSTLTNRLNSRVDGAEFGTHQAFFIPLQ